MCQNTQNHYQKDAQLFLSESSRHEVLFSDEGATQGDPAAMAFYATGIRPLIDELEKCIQELEHCLQSWFADDSSALGKLVQIKVWWTKLAEIGPKYGYFPKPSKCVLTIKDRALLPEARALFDGTGIQITLAGQRHLGAVIGNDDYKSQYVSEKVAK